MGKQGGRFGVPSGGLSIFILAIVFLHTGVGFELTNRSGGPIPVWCLHNALFTQAVGNRIAFTVQASFQRRGNRARVVDVSGVRGRKTVFVREEMNVRGRLKRSTSSLSMSETVIKYAIAGEAPSNYRTVSLADVDGDDGESHKVILCSSITHTTSTTSQFHFRVKSPHPVFIPPTVQLGPQSIHKQGGPTTRTYF